MAESQLLTYPELRARLNQHWLAQYELPTEFTRSIPLPTLRWGIPGYAVFASPVVRRPGLPLEQGAPDRWFVVDAYQANVVLYARCQACHFAPGESWGSVTLPQTHQSLAEARAQLARLEGLLDALAPKFFTAEPIAAPHRQTLLLELSITLPQPLHDQYQALTPDFYHWLLDIS